MLKWFIGSLAFLGLSSLHAGPAPSFVCVTEYPTTSVTMEYVQEEAVVQVIHHHGFKFMPLHTGTITPYDLETMSKKAEDFSALGDQYEFRWKASKCEMDENGLIQCLGGNPTMINGIEVRPYTVYFKKNQMMTPVGKFENTEVVFMLDFKGKTHQFSMTYQNWECSLGKLNRRQLLDKR